MPLRPMAHRWSLPFTIAYGEDFEKCHVIAVW